MFFILNRSFYLSTSSTSTRIDRIIGQMHNLHFIIAVGTTCESWSPRWASGSPRMLLMLIREFESRRGEILIFFAKIKKDQLLRAPSVGKHNSTRVDEGRNS